MSKIGVSCHGHRCMSWHCRREGEVERRTDRGAPDQESPSRKRRRDKQGGVDGGMREAGEITEGRYRDRDRDVDQWHRSR